MRLRGKSTLGVLVSSDQPYFIQMHVCFRVIVYELYLIDGKSVQYLSCWKVKVKVHCTCNKGMLILQFIFCACSVCIYHIKTKSLV